VLVGIPESDLKFHLDIVLPRGASSVEERARQADTAHIVALGAAWREADD